VSEDLGPNDLPAPGLGRRLGAAFYDLLLLFAVLWSASFPFVFVAGGAGDSGIQRLVFQFYLLAVAFFFYRWFWVHGGQTLGMRTWRLRVTRANGGPLGWRLALARFSFALLSLLCLGLGFWWALIDRERRTWHNRLSGTRLVLVKENI
jgi:uncharacterized RDD family membrane protein YckC